MAIYGGPLQCHVYPPRNSRPLIAGLIKGNQWLLIIPDHKAGYVLGVPRGIGGCGLPLDLLDGLMESSRPDLLDGTGFTPAVLDWVFPKIGVFTPQIMDFL